MAIAKYPCTVDGVEYKSEYAAAKALGINVSSLRARLISSSYPEYTSRHYQKKDRRKLFISCRIDGVEYPCISAASRELKMSGHALKRRLASFDYPNYICADIPKKPAQAKPLKYTVRGKLYRTLQEIANVEGLTRERIRQKMNNPSFPDYISADIPKGPPPPPRPKYMVEGRHYKTMQEIADAVGSSIGQISYRVNSPAFPEYQRLRKKA